MRRNPGTYHLMKMTSATTRTRRPPRTGATSAPPSGHAAPPAPLPPGASVGLWTQRPPAQSAPPANPLAPPAPWARNATKSPTPHYPFPPPARPTLPPLSREWMWNGAVSKLHSRSSTLCGVHNPASSAIHSSPSSPALGTHPAVRPAAGGHNTPLAPGPRAPCPFGLGQPGRRTLESRALGVEGKAD